MQLSLSKVIYVSLGYMWSVIDLTLLTINIFKDQLILGFVYHVVVQSYHLEICQTTIFLPQYLIKTTLKSLIMHFPVK